MILVRDRRRNKRRDTAIADGFHLNRRVDRLDLVLWHFSRRLAIADLRLRRVRLFFNSVIFMRLLPSIAALTRSSKHV
jgi:hypothetical protein